MKRNLGPKASKNLQLWLWQVSHFPVLQKWKDLGVRNWPRHINVGRCSKKTCSFPSEMKCRISATTDVGVLRWHCLDRFAQRKDTCGWSLFIPLSQSVNASVCTDGTHACYLRSCHVYFSMNSHWSMRLHLSLPLFNLFFPSYYIIISFLLRYLLLQYCKKLWSCK